MLSRSMSGRANGGENAAFVGFCRLFQKNRGTRRTQMFQQDLSRIRKCELHKFSDAYP